MKAIILLALISMVSAAHINKEDIKDSVEEVIEYYKTLNDNLDIDTLFEDDTKLYSYIQCFINAGPCTELASSYKAVIPDAARTACRRCTSAQKHMGNKFFVGLKEKKPHEYQSLRKFLDPEDKYFEAYEKAMADF